MNKEKDSFIWIKNASTQCFVALFPESTKTMLSWQVFWLIPLWMPSHPPGGQWLVEYSKILEGLTAAGLFRICTWFPFSSLISNRTGRGETKTGTKILKTIRFANTPDNFCYLCPRIGSGCMFPSSGLKGNRVWVPDSPAAVKLRFNILELLSPLTCYN